MKFIEEKELRDQFWKKYGYRSSIISYQFECPARHGSMDLVTLEKVQNADKKDFHIEIVSWEFKLNDIKKALSQAYKNSEYCHKCWIVVPIDKKKIVVERYGEYFEKYPFLGCVGVHHPTDGQGQWEIIYRARYQNDEKIKVNQSILKLACKVL